MQLARAAFLCVLTVSLCACGSRSLDTTNVDTFARTLDQMIEPMPEADREALAGAILAVHANARHDRILPSNLPHQRDVDGLLDPRSRHDFIRDIVRSDAGTMHGKTASELLAMAADTYAAAERHQDLEDRHRADRQRAVVRERLADLEARLQTLQADVKTAETVAAERREDVQDDLALLDGLQVSLDAQEPEYDAGYLRSTLDLTFTNQTEHTVYDAKYGFEWAYASCSGYRHLTFYPRLFGRPLVPEASASVTQRTGLGWVPESVKNDHDDRSCSITSADDFAIRRVVATGISFGDPPRQVDRHTIAQELDRLDAAVESRQQKVAATRDRIREANAELAAL